MNIAMFGHKIIPTREGGVEVVVSELASRMAQKGHDVTCYNRGWLKQRNTREIQVKECSHKVIRIKNVWTLNTRGLSAMTSSLSAAVCTAVGRYDVVHIHAEGPAAMCWLPKLFRKRVIVTVHGLDWKRAKWGRFASNYIKWGEHQAVKHADEIIVLSQNVKQYFKEEYGRDTVYIPNGVSKPDYKEANTITDKWGLTKDSYVLFVGRLVPEKGLSYLIEAWNEIQSDKTLVIVGDSSDSDSYVKQIKDLAGKNVLFVGFQQETTLEELYSNAYIYVLPSDIEGMPLTLLEAMSYGNCCVVSDISECRETVGENAVFFRKSNADDLRETIQSLLLNRERVSKYKQLSADFILAKPDWDDITEKTLEIYVDES